MPPNKNKVLSITKLPDRMKALEQARRKIAASLGVSPKQVEWAQVIDVCISQFNQSH